jgi:hypothetical protein
MSDVILVPVTTVQPDLVTQTDSVVYVPLASKTAHGIVKIGDGLTITPNGLLSFDRSEVAIKEIALNGNLLLPDENKRVNLVLSKNDVGLDKVNNTSDLDKPVSTATQRELLRIENMVSGAKCALVYDNYREMVDAINADTGKSYSVGQSIYINKVDVPDLWVYAVEDNKEEYVYVDDSLITDALNVEGKIKIGYYVLAALESNRVVLDNVVTLDTVQNITGIKVFTEQIGILNGSEGEINYIKHINNNFLISSSDGENIINIDEQLKTFNFYNKPLALENYVDSNFISYNIVQELTDEQKQIARNNIGAGSGGGSVDLSNYVTLNTDQTITGNKTINAELEINSTAEDYSRTSHLVINEGMVQLMNQDTLGNGGSLVITPTGGVQISTSGDSKFTYNGKEITKGTEIVWWEE